MASTNNVSTFYSTKSKNIRKRKQEVKEILELESKRKKFTCTHSESGSSSLPQEPSDRDSGSSISVAGSPLPADIEEDKSRLLYVFDQVGKDITIDVLKSAITMGNKDVIKALSKVFDKSVFPPQSSLTCARCEQPFDPNYNTKTACKLYHPGEEIDRIHKFHNGSTWQCYVCNKTWDSDDCCDFFGVDTGFCFVGPHTAVEYELDKDFEHEDDLEDVKRKKYW